MAQVTEMTTEEKTEIEAAIKNIADAQDKFTARRYWKAYLNENGTPIAREWALKDVKKLAGVK